MKKRKKNGLMSVFTQRTENRGTAPLFPHIIQQLNESFLADIGIAELSEINGEPLPFALSLQHLPHLAQVEHGFAVGLGLGQGDLSLRELLPQRGGPVGVTFRNGTGEPVFVMDMPVRLSHLLKIVPAERLVGPLFRNRDIDERGDHRKLS